MIIEALTVGAVAKGLYNIDKASKMDEKALKKYARAFEINEEARLLVQNKAELTDKRLANVAKKKRAIINNTLPQFIEVYSKIQQIDLSQKKEIKELSVSDNVQKIDAMTISVKKSFTEKELVCGFLVNGFTKMDRKDSERYLSAANNQLRTANVVSSQAESIACVYDAIITQADRVAKLLMAMNALFVKSIAETKKTIEQRGTDLTNYSEYEKGILMTCVNIAVAMSDLMDIPVVDANGKLCEAAEKMIVTGETYLSQMNEKLNS